MRPIPTSHALLAGLTHTPDRRGFIALLQAFRASGGTAPGDVVSRLLAEQQAARSDSLATLIETSQVFGFEWRGGLWIPMLQFHADDLSLHAGVQDVRAELPDAWSGWAVAAWFATPQAQLHGQSPADAWATQTGRVVQAARDVAAVDLFVPYHARRADGLDHTC